jgi:hypothetical protein
MFYLRASVVTACAGTSLIAAVSNATTASAAEMCVTCADPPALYRCALADETGAANVPGFQLLCIKELAARGGHKSCTVDRTRATAPCDAPLVTVALPPGLPTAIPPSPQGAAATVPPAALATGEPQPATPANGPPDTVEALAKTAAEQSKKDWDKTQSTVKETTQAAGQELKKAGSAVGNAVKDTWTCLTTLFARC